MALLTNPRGNHIIHLSLLGAFLLFDFLTLAISAAFIHEGKQLYFGYYFDASGLILATSVFAYIITFAFLMFNTYGDLYQGIKNSIMVELIAFFVLFILHLAGAAALSSDSGGFSGSSKGAQLGRATLAFAWLSTLTLIVLLAFLLTWTLLHRRRRIETSIFKSNIKEYFVDGNTGLRAGDTGMSSLPPSNSVRGRATEAPTAVPETMAPETARV